MPGRPSLLLCEKCVQVPEDALKPFQRLVQVWQLLAEWIGAFTSRLHAQLVKNRLIATAFLEVAPVARYTGVSKRTCLHNQCGSGCFFGPDDYG